MRAVALRVFIRTRRYAENSFELIFGGAVMADGFISQLGLE